MFAKAKPIYITNKRKTVNFEAGFRCDFEADETEKYSLLVTGSTYYKIYLNGVFLSYGPARSSHGYMKCDNIELPVRHGKNRLAIEVAGYNCPSYYTIPVPSFLCAEILRKNEALFYTGRDFKGIRLDGMRNIVCQRYSFQRPFGEVWNFDANDERYNWKTSDNICYDSVSVCPVEEEFIKRDVFFSERSVTAASEFIESGKVVKKDGSFIKELPLYKSASVFKTGYLIESMPEFPPSELYGDFIADGTKRTTLKSGEYIIFALPTVKSGFIMNKITALSDSKLHIFFAEHNYKNGMIFDAIGKLCSIVKYNLAKSEKEYELESFEPYSCKYIGLAVTEGEVAFDTPRLRSLSYPSEKASCTSLMCDDKELSDIFEASRITFCESTFDIYMDCPGRERGGWLCDSYFTARSEDFFASENVVEKAFLENFVMAKEFPNIPSGMLPMVYPSETATNDSGFIPQWAMWYVVELCEYIKNRSRSSAEKYRKLCYDLLLWFEKYENSDGLLESMDGWNFIEWSKANDWVTGLNYPTNMLYCGMLRSMATLFDDKELLCRAEDIKAKIIDQSFDGKFFHDHAHRGKDDSLSLLPDISETCQYYAMFFGIADKEDARFDGFCEMMLCEFGPKRGAAHPEIARSAPFIGNYLRLFVLLENKRFDILLENVRLYFGYMAKETGTLWEFPTLERVAGSLCHGFASLAGVFGCYALSGISLVDKKKKLVEIDKNFLCGINFTFRMKTENGDITVSEKNGVKEILLPDGWKTV